jgi:hypothetical protein
MPQSGATGPPAVSCHGFLHEPCPEPAFSVALRVVPEKTRIAFQVRMSFAQVTPRRAWLDGHVVLARRRASPRFRRIETFSPRNHVHFFRIEKLEEIDAEFRERLAEAYAVGQQEHLAKERRELRG